MLNSEKGQKKIYVFEVTCLKKLGVDKWGVFVSISFIFSLQRAYKTLKQNLVKTLKSLTKTLKPFQSHLMAQKLQISDFLVDKYKKLLYLKKNKNF